MKSNMNQIDRPAAVDGPVGSEGGRSPSTLSTGQRRPVGDHARRSPGPLAPGQRWSVARKREVVLRLLRGETAELLSRELGVPIFKLEQWRQKAEAALDGALKEREADPASDRARRGHAAHRRAQHGGRAAPRPDRAPGPLARRRSR